MNRRFVKYGLFILLVILCGLGFNLFRRPLLVETSFAKKREVVEYVVASGKLRAVRQSSLGPEVSGVVDKVLCDFGDSVTNGQVLIILKKEDIEQQLEKERLTAMVTREEFKRINRPAYPEEIRRAEAELARATAASKQASQDYQRIFKLYQAKVNSQTELDQFRTAADQAEAAEKSARETLELLRQQPRSEEVSVANARLKEKEAVVAQVEKDLAKRIIRSPHDGIVLQRMAEPGQSVVPGTTLLVVAASGETEIYVETDENNLSKLQTGQPAYAIAPSYRERPFTARLIQIGPGVDYERGTVGLRLKPESLPDYARLNMTVDVNIEVMRIPSAVSVPISSLLEIGGTNFVYVVDNSRTQMLPVKIKGKGAIRAAVEGLSIDKPVVVHANSVKNGQKIRSQPILEEP